jgi:uncharacterized RDD family membrane protein YckC
MNKPVSSSLPPPPAPHPTGGPPPPPPPSSRQLPPPAPRITSSDLSDLLGQLGDGTHGTDGTHGREVEPSAARSDPRDFERPRAAATAVMESTGTINFDPDLASFASRAGGWMIDTVITTLALLPGLLLLLAGSGIARLLALPLLGLGLVLVAWSYTVAVAQHGQWVGNRLMSTTVVNATNGEFVDRPHAFTRFIVRAVFSPIFFAGFVLAFTNTSRRTFHDQTAETVVIRPRRASWSIDEEGAESTGT